MIKTNFPDKNVAKVQNYLRICKICSIFAGVKRNMGIVMIGFYAFFCMGCTSKNEVSFSYDAVTNIAALWEIIDTKYCYVEEKGIDWAAVREEYISKAAALEENDQVALFDLCSEMLNLLRDGHVNLYAPFDVSHSSDWYISYPANFSSSLQAKYLQNYRTAGGLIYSTIDNDSIGYVYYSSFSNGFSSTNLAWVFRAFKDCRGIVLDVRNNGGGSLDNAYKLASPFFTENRLVGWWHHKTGPGHNDFSELEPLYADTSLTGNRWLRPVAVLCNRRSYSATNSFVNMMRYADNCVIIGGLTGGGGGMPLSYELPCGWMVRFSSVRMYDRDKKDIENGITPQVEINMVSEDKDDIIEKAIELINKAYNHD
jgi:hypothetical protein